MFLCNYFPILRQCHAKISIFQCNICNMLQDDQDPPIQISEIYTVALTPLDPVLQKVGGPLTPLTPWFRRH